MNENQAPALPEYVCQKRVKAARIFTVVPPAEPWHSLYTLLLDLPDGKQGAQAVPGEFIDRHAPKPGGYFLRFDGGLAGYASEETFLRDYARVPNPVQVKNMAELELLLSMRPPLPTPDPAVLTVKLPLQNT
jgi:hypothetical protein